MVQQQVIIRVELLPEREELQNEIPLLLDRVSPSSRILWIFWNFIQKADHALVYCLLPTY